MDSIIHPLIIALARDFCVGEQLKLRRYLVDRMRCELDLSEAEAESTVVQLENTGCIRSVEISHYDPAAEDVTCESAVVALPRLFDQDGLLIAG